MSETSPDRPSVGDVPQARLLKVEPSTDLSKIDVSQYDGFFVEKRDMGAPFRYSKLGEPDLKEGRYYERSYLKPTENGIFYCYMTEGLFSKPVNLKNTKLWDKGFTIVTPDNPSSDLPNQAKKFFLKYNVIPKARICTTNKSLFGMGALWFQTRDIETPEELKQPLPESGFTLRDIATLSKLSMPENAVLRDKDNNITHYIFKFHTESGSTDVPIHKSRLLLFKHDPLGLHPVGLSEMLPAIRHMDEFISIIWSDEQLLKGRAAPPTIVYFPSGMPKADREDIIQKFKGTMFNSVIGIPRKSMAPEQNLEVQWNQEFSSFGNVEPIHTLIKTVYATSVNTPESILYGTKSGAVTGSETDILEYFSMLSADQKMENEPVMRELIKLAQQWGLIESQDYFEILWEPLFEITPRDKSNMLLNTSVEAINRITAGQDVVFDRRGFIDYNATSTRSETEGVGRPERSPRERAPENRNPTNEAPARQADTLKFNQELDFLKAQMMSLQDTISVLTGKMS